jgi:hypothetical protein
MFIFERTLSGYLRVLDDVTIPGHAAYAFSGPRSHIYDLSLQERRPYQVPVRFAPGAFGITLTGSVAVNVGQDYVFWARAGQRATFQLTKHTGHRPVVALSYGNDKYVDFGGLFAANAWSGRLPRTGTHELTVYGPDNADAARLSAYSLRLDIH